MALPLPPASADDDHSAVHRKKPRMKKARDKFSHLWAIPSPILNQSTEVQLPGGKTKRGKRFGFEKFARLVCKECRPAKTFHKTGGLSSHRQTSHRGGRMGYRQTSHWGTAVGNLQTSHQGGRFGQTSHQGGRVGQFISWTTVTLSR